jgi:hypothetical protein
MYKKEVKEQRGLLVKYINGRGYYGLSLDY